MSFGVVAPFFLIYYLPVARSYLLRSLKEPVTNGGKMQKASGRAGIYLIPSTALAIALKAAKAVYVAMGSEAVTAVEGDHLPRIVPWKILTHVC